MDYLYFQCGDSFIVEELKSLLNNESHEYYNFKCIPVENELVLKCKTLHKILQGKKFQAGILKMDPNHQYTWHVDRSRQVAINMQLTGFGKSRSLFATPEGENLINFKTTELKYEEGKYFLFNTRVPHMVDNAECDRYLFSIEFLDDTTYEELLCQTKLSKQ